MMSLNKYKLADIAKIEISGVDKKTIEGEIPVRLCNFVDVYYNWAITKEKAKSFMVASAKQTEIDKCSIGKGMVAITKDSETRDDIGVATYIADDFDNVVLGYHCALIIPNSAVVDGKYLNAFMHTRYIQKYFENNASGSGQRYTLSNDTIGNIPVLLPSIDEQHTIGKVLADIDRKIELNKRINDNLEAMAKQLYDYWFVQFDFPNEEGKPYKSSGGAMVWNEKLKREIPQGWSGVSLKDLALTSRNAITPVENEVYQHFSIPSFDACGSYSLDNGSDIKSDKFVLQKGQLLVSKLNPWFNRVVWVPKGTNMIGSTEFVVLNPNNESESGYIYSVIKSQKFIAYCSQAATGTSHSQRRVSPDVLMAFKVVYEQGVVQKYGCLIEKIQKLQTELLSEIAMLTKQRDELLPLLMNGQATVNYHLSVHFFLPLYYIETNTILWHERNNYTSRFRRYASGSD